MGELTAFSLRTRLSLIVDSMWAALRKVTELVRSASKILSSVRVDALRPVMPLSSVWAESSLVVVHEEFFGWMFSLDLVEVEALWTCRGTVFSEERKSFLNLLSSVAFRCILH